MISVPMKEKTKMMKLEKKLEIVSRIEAGEGVSTKENVKNPRRTPFSRKRRPSMLMPVQKSRPNAETTIKQAWAPYYCA
jgi:hypothetical protein